MAAGAAVEAEWLALRARWRHMERRESDQAERASHRRRESLSARLAKVIAQLGVVSTVGTVPPRGGRRGKPESCPPPAGAALDDVLAPRMAVIAHHVSEMELLLDALTGRGDPRDWLRLTTDEKNQIILVRFVGVPSAWAARDAPELGSQRTIERVRRAVGCRPSDGRPLD